MGNKKESQTRYFNNISTNFNNENPINNKSIQAELLRTEQTVKPRGIHVIMFFFWTKLKNYYKMFVLILSFYILFSVNKIKSYRVRTN